MFAFARKASASAPEGSPLHILPVQANAEWALWQSDREAGSLRMRQVNLTWRKGAEFRSELDAALTCWFGAAAHRHAMWYQDLNFLAYGLHRAGRHADAKPVFEAIGPYAEDIPWAWAADHDYDTERAFLAARRAALRS